MKQKNTSQDELTKKMKQNSRRHHKMSTLKLFQHYQFSFWHKRKEFIVQCTNLASHVNEIMQFKDRLVAHTTFNQVRLTND
jgi:hypothetical protein